MSSKFNSENDTDLNSFLESLEKQQANKSNNMQFGNIGETVQNSNIPLPTGLNLAQDSNININTNNNDNNNNNNNSNNPNNIFGQRLMNPSSTLESFLQFEANNPQFMNNIDNNETETTHLTSIKQENDQQFQRYTNQSQLNSYPIQTSQTPIQVPMLSHVAETRSNKMLSSLSRLNTFVPNTPSTLDRFNSRTSTYMKDTTNNTTTNIGSQTNNNIMSTMLQDSDTQYLDLFNNVTDSGIYSNNMVFPVSKTSTLDSNKDLGFSSMFNSILETETPKYFSPATQYIEYNNNNNNNNNNINNNVSGANIDAQNLSIGPEIKIEDVDLFDITPIQQQNPMLNQIPLPNSKSESSYEDTPSTIDTPQFYHNLTPTLEVHPAIISSPSTSDENNQTPLLTVPGTHEHKQMRLGRQKLHSSRSNSVSRSRSRSRSKSANNSKRSSSNSSRVSYLSDASNSEWESQSSLSPGNIPSTLTNDNYPNSDIGDYESGDNEEDHQEEGDEGEERKYICEICGKDFTRPYNLKSHLRTHTNERPYPCRICGKRFARQHDRKRHEDLHSGEKRFQCKGTLQTLDSQGKSTLWGCGKRFARTDALRRHFWTDNGKECIKPYVIQCIGLGSGDQWEQEGVKLAMANAIALMKANEPETSKSKEKDKKGKSKRGRPRKDTTSEAPPS